MIRGPFKVYPIPEPEPEPDRLPEHLAGFLLLLAVLFLAIAFGK